MLRLPTVFDSFCQEDTVRNSSAYAHREACINNFYSNLESLASVYWPAPHGAAAPLPARRDRLSFGGHIWRIQCSEGIPQKWVAADAQPDKAVLLVLGPEDGDPHRSGESSRVTRRTVLSVGYAIAIWGTRLADSLVEAAARVQGLPTEGILPRAIGMREFYCLLASASVPRRGVRFWRVSDFWLGVPLCPNDDQCLSLYRGGRGTGGGSNDSRVCQ